MDFFARYLKQLEAHYPETARTVDLKARISPLLFCPHKLQLPQSVAKEAQEIVRAFFALRSLTKRDQELSARSPEVIDPGNTSVLMSYDFHIDDAGRLRLIEINTNASAGLLADLLYEVQSLKNPFSESFHNEIVRCFAHEAELALPGRKIQRALVVDENPIEQRQFTEFVMYSELFRHAGWRTDIVDPSELVFSDEDSELRYQNERIDLVYNRHTDFYFETPANTALRKAMMARSTCISPHPHEYRLLADKERLLELSKPGAIDSLPLSEGERAVIHSALIRTVDVHEFSSADDLWKERKRWFFKTKQSHGGKAAYRGSSMSRGTFENIMNGPYLAQEYIPAPTIKPEGTEEEFKYDLRFFVYRDRIQLACARLYQGQMTNAQTPGGGLTAIEWV